MRQCAGEREDARVWSITKTAQDAIEADASASTDGDRHVVDYLRDVGDGTYATGARVQHVFARPGSHRVTLTVQDDRRALGFATQNAEFTITPHRRSTATPARRPTTSRRL
jgi:PKD repeat protein